MSLMSLSRLSQTGRSRNGIQRRQTLMQEYSTSASGGLGIGWTWWSMTVSPQWITSWCTAIQMIATSSGVPLWKKPMPSKQFRQQTNSKGLCRDIHIQVLWWHSDVKFFLYTNQEFMAAMRPWMVETRPMPWWTLLAACQNPWTFWRASLLRMKSPETSSLRECSRSIIEMALSAALSGWEGHNIQYIQSAQVRKLHLILFCILI